MTRLKKRLMILVSMLLLLSAGGLLLPQYGLAWFLHLRYPQWHWHHLEVRWQSLSQLDIQFSELDMAEQPLEQTQFRLQIKHLQMNLSPFCGWWKNRCILPSLSGNDLTVQLNQSESVRLLPEFPTTVLITLPTFQLDPNQHLHSQWHGTASWQSSVTTQQQQRPFVIKFSFSEDIQRLLATMVWLPSHLSPAGLSAEIDLPTFSLQAFRGWYTGSPISQSHSHSHWYWHGSRDASYLWHSALQTDAFSTSDYQQSALVLDEQANQIWQIEAQHWPVAGLLDWLHLDDQHQQDYFDLLAKQVIQDLSAQLDISHSKQGLWSLEDINIHCEDGFTLGPVDINLNRLGHFWRLEMGNYHTQLSDSPDQYNELSRWDINIAGNSASSWRIDGKGNYLGGSWQLEGGQDQQQQHWITLRGDLLSWQTWRDRWLVNSHQPVIHYLVTALQKADFDQVELIWHQRQGLQAYTQFQQAAFRFDQAWPAIDQLNGKLSLTDHHLQVQIEQGQWQKASLQHVMIDLDLLDHGQPNLHATGDWTASLDDLVDWGEATPLKNLAKQATQWLDKGDLVGTADVNLPHLDVSQLHYQIHGQANHLALTPSKGLKFTNVSAEFDVDPHQLKLGWSIPVSQPDQASSSSQSTSSPQETKGLLQYLFASSQFEAQADFDLALAYLLPQFQPWVDGTVKTSLHAIGDLQQVDIDGLIDNRQVIWKLPSGAPQPPLTQPIHMTYSAKAKQQSVIIQALPLFYANINKPHGSSKSTWGGQVCLNACDEQKKHPLSPARWQLWVGLGNTNPEQWIALPKQLPADRKQQDVTLSMWLQIAHLQGTPWPDTPWNALLHHDPHQTRLQIHSAYVKGQLNYQSPVWQWQGNLCAIPGKKSNKKSHPSTQTKSTFDLSDIIKLLQHGQANCQHVINQGQDLGQWQLKTIHQEVMLDGTGVLGKWHALLSPPGHNQQSLLAPAKQSAALAAAPKEKTPVNWLSPAQVVPSDPIEAAPSPTEWQLHVTGHSDSIDPFWLLFHSAALLTKSPFDVQLHLHSQNPADWLAWEGTGHWQSGAGILIKVKSGFSRILNLTNPESIFRRLRLDFSDVTSNSFMVQQIHADWSLHHGVLQLSHFLLQSEAADIVLSGQIDLSAKQLDLKAKVKPHVNSSLSLATGVALGNPLIGAMIWAVGKLSPFSIDQVAESSYTIKGDWRDPNIVSDNERPIEAKSVKLK